MNRPETDRRMSNSDGQIDDGMEEDLRQGMRSAHYAWDFCGDVWYDAERGVFFEAVMQYHVLVAIVSSPTLAGLMQAVNDRFGYR